MTEYAPDRWVILHITSDTEPPIRRVFAGWIGGYIHGDSWKLSSGIIQTDEFKDRYEFINHSGSKYICYKTCHGLSSYMASMLQHWISLTPGDDNVKINMEMIYAYPEKKENKK